MHKIRLIKTDIILDAEFEVFDENIIILTFPSIRPTNDSFSCGVTIDNLDYSQFNTIYKIQGDSVCLSNDGSVFVDTKKYPTEEEIAEQLRVCTINTNIDTLKAELATTDYYFVKTLENQLLGKDDEYTQEFLQQISVERELVRAKINQLETQIS